MRIQLMIQNARNTSAMPWRRQLDKLFLFLMLRPVLLRFVATLPDGFKRVKCLCEIAVDARVLTCG